MLALALLALPSIALASAVAAANAAKHGLMHRHSELKKLPAGKIVGATAHCPDGSSVVGGGLLIQGANTATGIHSSYPVDDGDRGHKPDDGWRGVANSRSAGDKKLMVDAVCSSRGHFSYELGLAGAPDGDQGGGYALCDPGDQVAGGGVELSKGNASLAVAASYPLDIDVNTVPDDGWYGIASNESGSPQTVTTYAICARSGSYQYVAEDGSAPTFGQGAVAAPCPGGTGVVAGGGVTATSTTSVELAQTDPYSDGNHSPPDDGWLTHVNNNAGVPLDFTTFAVCRS